MRFDSLLVHFHERSKRPHTPPILGLAEATLPVFKRATKPTLELAGRKGLRGACGFSLVGVAFTVFNPNKKR